MNERLSYNLLVAGVVFWCLLLLSPSLLLMMGTTYTPLVNFIYKSFSSICHQYDSHSLHLGGHKFAVCGRCSAMYFGFLLGLVLCCSPSRNAVSRPLAFWVIACVPMIVDVMLDVLGWHSSTLVTRLATGGWFGAVVAIILTPLYIEACVQLFQRKLPGAAYESKT